MIHASIWPWGVLCRGVSVCLPLNSSQTQVEAGMEKGWRVEGGGGGGVATAVPAAAVQKPRKNINLSEKVTLSRSIGRIGRNS